MSESTQVQNIEQAPERKGPPVAQVGALGIEIQNLDTMWWLACRVVESNLAPKDCKSASDIFVRAQHGMAAGLTFMQSVQYVSNVNGRPCIWGPPLKGLIIASGKVKSWTEKINGTDPFKDDYSITITVERTDMPGETPITFSTAMAKRAGLMGRDTYKQYPEDMLYYRCMGRVAKRIFPDVISGLVPAEDSRDIIEVTATSAEAMTEPAEKPRNLNDVATRAKASAKEKPKPKAAPPAEPVPDKNGEIPDEGEGSDDDVPFDLGPEAATATESTLC